MAKYYGNIGFITSVETSPGIWEEEIVEYDKYGKPVYVCVYYNTAFTKLKVSVAIINSSSVGTTSTFIGESSVDICTSSHLIAFFSSSNLIHRYVNLSQIFFLISGQFSQTHAVNIIESTPHISAMYAQIYFIILLIYTSSAN